jgi:hypothetical protein
MFPSFPSKFQRHSQRLLWFEDEDAPKGSMVSNAIIRDLQALCTFTIETPAQDEGSHRSYERRSASSYSQWRSLRFLGWG